MSERRRSLGEELAASADRLDETQMKYVDFTLTLGPLPAGTAWHDPPVAALEAALEDVMDEYAAPTGADLDMSARIRPGEC